MDVGSWLSLLGDHCGSSSFVTVSQTKNMAEVFQVKVLKKYREPGKYIFHGLHSNSCAVLLRLVSDVNN